MNVIFLHGSFHVCNEIEQNADLKLKHIDGLVQDCSISIALAMEILLSCIKPSTYMMLKNTMEKELYHHKSY